MLKKLWNKLPQDKQLHFIGGVIISLVTGVSLLALGWPLWIHFLVTGAVAVGKEVYDRMHPDKHTCDVWDAVATLAGSLPAHLLLCLATLLL